MSAKFYVLNGELMQAVATNDDWEEGQSYEFYADALVKAEELAVGSPLETFTIVKAFATVAVPKQRPPKATLF
jgi:hypothetical protein